MDSERIQKHMDLGSFYVRFKRVSDLDFNCWIRYLLDRELVMLEKEAEE